MSERYYLRRKANSVIAWFGGTLAVGGIMAVAWGCPGVTSADSLKHEDTHSCGALGDTVACANLNQDEVDYAAAMSIIENGAALAAIGGGTVLAAYHRGKYRPDPASTKLPFETEHAWLLAGTLPAPPNIPSELT